MVIDGYFIDKVQFELYISTLRCPHCDSGKVLKNKRCEECDVSFEAVLVISDSQAFILFLPSGNEVPPSILSKCLLQTNAIPLPPCPYCGRAFVDFRKDAGNTEKPFCCEVFFPPSLNKETGDIVFSYKSENSPYVENDELQSLSIFECFQEILKLTGHSDKRTTPAPDSETVINTEIETRRPQHKSVKENILKYLEERGDPVRKKELIEVTGASQQAVTVACNELMDEGLLCKIKRGVYALPEHKE